MIFLYHFLQCVLQYSLSPVCITIFSFSSVYYNILSLQCVLQYSLSPVCITIFSFSSVYYNILSLQFVLSYVYVLCVYVYMCVCIYVCMHYVCMFACLYVCMHVCMYLCKYVCMYVSFYVWMYLCILWAPSFPWKLVKNAWQDCSEHAVSLLPKALAGFEPPHFWGMYRKSLPSNFQVKPWSLRAKP
jgi:hypothetical protein